MRKTFRNLLLAEVLVAFVPLCIGWAILAILSLFHLLFVGTPDFHLESLAFMVAVLVAGAIGGLGLNAMCVYLFFDRKRSLSRRRMAAFCAVGIVGLTALAAASLPSVFGERRDYFGIVYLVPLLCALHILWLGRSYFAER